MRKKYELSTVQVIVLGFLITILAGSVILTLPVCSADGTGMPYLDALFTATTSVCVTGLVVVDTYAYFSVFGQAVILLLVQCGGLGIITFSTFVMVLIGRKVTLKDRLLLEDAFNLNTLRGLVRFLRRVIKGTLIVEGIGAVCYMFVFIPQYGLKGIWIAVFNSVSAFCNAGMDIIGDSSLTGYVGNPWVNLVTMALIVLGGIGFIVWWDIVGVAGEVRRGTIPKGSCVKRLKLHTKIVLTTTLILIFGGAVLIFALEYRNPETLGNLPFGTKIQAALFQSVTFRTAGFATISQTGLTSGTILVGLILMLIGGSPVGTAGGVKTTTIALVFLTTLATVRGREEVTVYKRTIPPKTIRKAVSVSLVFGAVLVVMILLMTVFETGSFLDIVYETVSALGTVGLSRNYTAAMGMAGKILIIFCMYLGRIGPISMAIAFQFGGGKRKVQIKYPTDDVTVG